MTYNPACVKAALTVGKLMPDNFTVLDIGSQTLTANLKASEERENFTTVPGLYKFMGASKYDAVDFNDESTIRADLNTAMALGPYDLVVNNGTLEHIFNPAAVFKTIHDSTKKGGHILHLVPWINWRNHGLYNFHPVLFHDLARANGYEIVAAYATDRNDTERSKVGIQETKSGPDGFLPEGSECNFNVLFVAVLKKTEDEPFKYPTQSKYDFYFPMDAAFEGADVQTEPFLHFRTKMQPELYTALEKDWPVDVKYTGQKGQNLLHQYSAGQLLAERRVSQVWEDFAGYFTSSTFLQRILQAFAPHIPKDHPAKRFDAEAGIRGYSRGPFQLDVQAAINTPVTKKSRVRGPHIDDPREVYAGLVYFPVEGDTAGGNLELFEWKDAKRSFRGRASMKKKLEVASSAVNKIAEVPYEAGEALFFWNDINAVHGVSPRSPTDNFRRYINIIGEIPVAGFDVK